MRIASQDPRKVFAGAKWIWPHQQGYDLVNCFVQARRTFVLAAVPRKCRIRVTADSRYELFVNGHYVCRGPARGYQYSWPYDEVDIARYLRRGKNVVAVLAHNYGVGIYQYISADAGGIILAGRAGSVDLSTGSDWRIRVAPGYVRHIARASRELGFQESFDARLDDGSWTRASYDDSEWQRPFCTAAGSMPWHAVEPRGIPMLREEVIRPVGIVSQCHGKSARSWRETENLTANYFAEKRAWRKPSTPLRRGKAARFRASAAGSGGFTAYVLDFGREVVGSIGLDVNGASPGDVIDAQVCETLSGLVPDVIDPSKDCRISLCNRLTLGRGATRHESFDPWGFRYLAVIVRETKKPVDIAVYLRTALYPLNVKADFQSSDPMLNDIYRISVRAQECCMLDAYVDCPWREQAQWWGDARVQAANTLHLAADARLLARGIRQTAGQEAPNGLTYGLTPTTSHHCILPDYTLTWIMTIWDYYRQTGDVSLVREYAPRMLRALSYFEGALAPNGLLPYDERYWLFLDWADVFKDGYPAIYNIMYFWALETASKLFALIGDRRESASLSKQAAASRRAIMSKLFDSKKRRFCGGLDWKGRPVSHDTPHSYALAIVSGLCPRHDRFFVDKRLLPAISGQCPAFRASYIVAEKYPRTPSPFFMYYVFEALKANGRAAAAIDCIRRWWGVFVKNGFTTTPEMWGEPKGQWSACHAWSAHPVVHFHNCILGVTQAAIGWRRITFAPVFETLQWAKGKVATPLGTVSVSWRRDGGQVDVKIVVPDGMTAEVRLPGVAETAASGSHRWVVNPTSR
jgi:hypothetical protein